MALNILLPHPGFVALSSIPAPTYSICASAILDDETELVVDISWGLIIPLNLIYSVPSVILNFFCPLISKLPSPYITLPSIAFINLPFLLISNFFVLKINSSEKAKPLKNTKNKMRVTNLFFIYIYKTYNCKK